MQIQHQHSMAPNLFHKQCKKLVQYKIVTINNIKGSGLRANVILSSFKQLSLNFIQILGLSMESSLGLNILFYVLRGLILSSNKR